jgi:type IV pilus assembly protein PilA
MFCVRCGSEMPSNAAFCAKCGASAAGPAPAAAPAVASASMQRPGIVTLLAVLQFLGAGAWALWTLFMLAGSFAGASESVPIGLVAAVFAGLGLAQFFCGYGLWNLKPYGRTLQLVFAWLGVLAFPIGTVIAILILVYLFKPGIKILFSERQAHEWTPEEAAQVSALAQRSSLITVIVVAAVVVGLVVVTGVAAALVVPGLLRARMSGNEASAIASLRAVNSAQAAFASSCGNGLYAATLAGLGLSPGGTQAGFVSSDLASDPATKSGYVIRLAAPPAAEGPRACNGAPVSASYVAFAEPVTVGSTGSRYFGTNQGMTVYQSPNPIQMSPAGEPLNAVPIQ